MHNLSLKYNIYYQLSHLTTQVLIDFNILTQYNYYIQLQMHILHFLLSKYKKNITVLSLKKRKVLK